jgi:hypothetical protein
VAYGWHVELPFGEAMRTRRCPHLAILLRSAADVPAAQASFYALGVQRNGWVMHRAWPGEAERERIKLREAGLDVDDLEARGRLAIDETPLTEPPGRWAWTWLDTAQSALDRGFDAIWWTGYPIGPDEGPYRIGLAYDQEWERCFSGRPSVSLCLYIVEGLDEATRQQRAEELATIHDALIVPSGNGFSAVPTGSSA